MAYQICPDKHVRFTGAWLEMQSPFGTLTRSYATRSDGVEVETVLNLPSATIQAEELGRFRRFVSRALAQTSIWFSLEPRRAAVGRRE